MNMDCPAYTPTPDSIHGALRRSESTSDFELYNDTATVAMTLNSVAPSSKVTLAGIWSSDQPSSQAMESLSDFHYEIAPYREVLLEGAVKYFFIFIVPTLKNTSTLER